METQAPGTPAAAISSQPLSPSPAVDTAAAQQALDALVVTANGLAQITDPAQHYAAGECLQKLTKLEKQIDADRKGVKAPYLAACRAIDGAGGALVDRIAEHKARLARMMGLYEFTRDLLNAKASPDGAGVVVKQADGGTPYTKTTKRRTWALVLGAVPPTEYICKLVNDKKIQEDVDAGVLDSAPWIKVDTEYKVSSR